jgi:hypothetical protein
MIDRRAVWRGLTAGFVASGAMSVLRLAAHRAGLIERMVPQELHTDVTGVDPSAEAPAHQFGAEVLHHAVGALAAAAFAAMTPKRPHAAHGVAFGLALWAIDVLALIPALRVVRLGGHLVDGAAHALYGAMVALAIAELAAQRRTSLGRARRLRRVG